MFDSAHRVALMALALAPPDDPAVLDAPPRRLRALPDAPATARPPRPAVYAGVPPRRHRPPGHPACAAGARPRGARAAVRRRRALLATVAATLLAALALPWGGAGGRPLATPGPALAGTIAHHARYIVQPGDTLWSIALRLDPTGDPRPLVTRLETQVHGDSVRPGERLVLP